MRPTNIYLTGSSPLYSPWTKVSYLQSAFTIGLGFSVSSGANLTATVQHTFDTLGIGSKRAVGISQVGTAITVTDQGYGAAQDQSYSLGNHMLSVGDSVQVENTGITGGDNLYQVATVVSATQYTVTSTVSQTATGGPNAKATVAEVFNHAILTGVTARTDGNYAFPICAIRLVLTAWTSGVACLQIRQGSGSLT